MIVVRVDNHWLVTDGNHRVYRALEMGRKTVRAIQSIRPRQERMDSYVKLVPRRLEAGYLGFEGMVVADNDAEALKLTAEDDGIDPADAQKALSQT